MNKPPADPSRYTPAEFRTFLLRRMRAAIGATYRADRTYKLRERDIRRQADTQNTPAGELRILLNTDIPLKDAHGAGEWHMQVARTYALALQVEMAITQDATAPSTPIDLTRE